MSRRSSKSVDGCDSHSQSESPFARQLATAQPGGPRANPLQAHDKPPVFSESHSGSPPAPPLKEPSTTTKKPPR